MRAHERTGKADAGKTALPPLGQAACDFSRSCGGIFLRQYVYALVEEQETTIGAGKNYARSVADGHPALQYFETVNPGRDIFLACEEDLTNDGLNELVVIYHNPEEGVINWMVALINRGDGTYDITEPTGRPLKIRPSVSSIWIKRASWNSFSPEKRTRGGLRHLPHH